MKRPSKADDDADEVSKEASDRSAKTRPEHFTCPLCGSQKSGSGYSWDYTSRQYICLALGVRIAVHPERSYNVNVSAQTAAPCKLTREARQITLPLQFVC